MPRVSFTFFHFNGQMNSSIEVTYLSQTVLNMLRYFFGGALQSAMAHWTRLTLGITHMIRVFGFGITLALTSFCTQTTLTIGSNPLECLWNGAEEGSLLFLLLHHFETIFLKLLFETQSNPYLPSAIRPLYQSIVHVHSTIHIKTGANALTLWARAQLIQSIQFGQKMRFQFIR